MLTPEDQKRIEEEEQYRATVRARVERNSARLSYPDDDDSSSWPRGSIALVVVGLIIAIAWFTQGPSASSIHNPWAAPIKESIVNGQIVVRPGQSIWYKITIPAGGTARVSGSFSVSGGAGNDIAAVIVDEMNLQNWINGHQAQAFWSTPGPQTADKFDVALAPGTYYLSFSNRMSLFSQKQVFVQADLYR